MIERRTLAAMRRFASSRSTACSITKLSGWLWPGASITRVPLSSGHVRIARSIAAFATMVASWRLVAATLGPRVRTTGSTCSSATEYAVSAGGLGPAAYLNFFASAPGAMASASATIAAGSANPRRISCVLR
jgi:hypothetical protein